MPENHTDKDRFAASSSRIQTEILTLLFPRKRRRSSPSPFISHRVLEAVASWILKSLVPIETVTPHSVSCADLKAILTPFSGVIWNRYSSFFKEE